MFQILALLLILCVSSLHGLLQFINGKYLPNYQYILIINTNINNNIICYYVIK